MKTFPAFQFYPGDFLFETSHLSTLARGAFLLAICSQWNRGFVPSSDEERRRVMGLSEEEYPPIWDEICELFIEDDDGKIVYEPLQIQYQTLVARSNAGQRSGESRRTKREQTTEQNANKLRTKREQSPNKSLLKTEDRRLKTEDRKPKPENRSQSNGESLPDLDDDVDCPELRTAFAQWLEYKRERRESYKPQGLKSVRTTLCKAARQHGVPSTCDAIESAMANNYQGWKFSQAAKGSKNGKALGIDGCGNHRPPGRLW